MIGLVPPNDTNIMLTDEEYLSVVLSAGAGHNVAFCGVDLVDTKHICMFCAMARQAVKKRLGMNTGSVVIEGRWETGERFDITGLSGNTVLVPCAEDLDGDSLEKVNKVCRYSHLINVGEGITTGLESAERGSRDTQVIVGMDWKRHCLRKNPERFNESNMLVSIEICQESGRTPRKSFSFGTLVDESTRLQRLLLERGVSTKWHRSYSLNGRYNRLGVMERDALYEITTMGAERAYLVAYSMSVLEGKEIDMSLLKRATDITEGCGIR